MKELLELGNSRKSIPHVVKLKTATKLRDYKEQAKIAKQKKTNVDFAVEVFNDKSVYELPDKVGITVFFPNKKNVTHMLCRIFNLSIGEKEFQRQVKELYKELLKKVPEHLKNKD